MSFWVFDQEVIFLIIIFQTSLIFLLNKGSLAADFLILFRRNVVFIINREVCFHIIFTEALDMNILKIQLSFSIEIWIPYLYIENLDYILQMIRRLCRNEHCKATFRNVFTLIRTILDWLHGNNGIY